MHFCCSRLPSGGGETGRALEFLGCSQIHEPRGHRVCCSFWLRGSRRRTDKKTVECLVRECMRGLGSDFRWLSIVSQCLFCFDGKSHVSPHVCIFVLVVVFSCNTAILDILPPLFVSFDNFVLRQRERTIQNKSIFKGGSKYFVRERMKRVSEWLSFCQDDTRSNFSMFHPGTAELSHFRVFDVFAMANSKHLQQSWQSPLGRGLVKSGWKIILIW